MTHKPSAAATGASQPSRATLERLLGYLADDPDNLRLRTDIFDTALALGDFDTAQQQAAWALGRQPADFAWRHRLAVLDMAQQQWAEASMLLQALLDEGQTDPAIVYNLAYVDFACGRFAEASARLRPLLDSQFARLPAILTLLLRCLHRQGALDEGLAIFGGYVGRTPMPSAEAFGVASLLALDAGRAEQAETWARQALVSEPLQHEALVANASVALGRRDTVTALRDLALALQRHPDDGRTLSAIGMTELLEGRLDAARAAFTRAVRAMPDHIGTWHGLGWCELLRKDVAAARVAFQAALALDPAFGESHGGLAVVQALSGLRSAAEESIRRSLKLDPSGLSARFAQAILSGEGQDPERFMRLARRTLEQHRTADGRSLADVVLAARPNGAAAPPASA